MSIWLLLVGVEVVPMPLEAAVREVFAQERVFQ